MVKFRGKTKLGEWYYGNLICRRDGKTLINFDEEKRFGNVEVIPASIGMFTGLPDKNGKEIYGSIPINGEMSKGGDILNHLTDMDEDGVHRGKFGYYEWNEKPVVFEDGTFKCPGYITLENYIAPLRYGESTIYEVVGTIYEKEQTDNPRIIDDGYPFTNLKPTYGEGETL